MFVVSVTLVCFPSSVYSRVVTLDITHVAISWFDLGVNTWLSLLHPNFQMPYIILGVSKHAVLKYPQNETAADLFVGSTRNSGKPQTEC
jgi:hypothetical protein